MNFKLHIVIALLLSIVSCKKENLCDCVKTTGQNKTEIREVSGFTCIDLADKIDLYLTQGPVYEVKVDAGRNLQSLIKTELDGETLKVVNKNRCNWVRGYKHKISVHITAPYFKNIRHNGLGVIESTNTIVQNEITLRTENSGDLKLDIQTNKVVCSAHGNGDFYLTGTTNVLENDYTGTNFLYAKGLTITNYAYLHSVSIGHAYINAPESGLMDIVLDQAGNVYYTGNPATIHLTRNNKGILIKE